MLHPLSLFTQRLNGRLTPLFLAFSTLWMWLSYWALHRHLTLEGILAESPKWRTFTLLVGIGVIVTSLLVFFIVANWPRIALRALQIHTPLPSFLRWSLAAILLVAFPWILYGRFGHIIQHAVIHFFLLWWFSWLLFALLRPSLSSCSRWGLWCLSVSVLSAAVLLARYVPSISSSPFTTAWSEGGVLFYASLFFSKTVYGVEAGLPVINPGRALMQSILFAVPGLPIIAHRVWDVFLWFALPVLVILAAGRRFQVLKHRLFPVFLLWSLLFFFQGPVYYHLLVVPLIVLLGFRGDRFWRSLLVVAVASLWGGLTRINWFPMAGLLAVALYLLEHEKQPLRRSVAYSFAWFVTGFSVAFLTSRLYMQLSGTPAGYFENPFQTPLLWDRLLPSTTNPWGALVSVLVFTLPILVFLTCSFWTSPGVHWFRRMGIAAILLVLFLGGLLVSVRIGGGNNLHNLDAYLVMLWLCGSALFFAKVPADEEPPHPPQPMRWLEALIFLLPVLVPLIFFRNTWPGPRNPAAWSDGLRAFRSQVEADLAAGRSVLISEQPQLIPFGFWESPPAFPEFEKIFMFEAAITQNRAYLTDLYRAIEEQRYDRIVTEPLYLKYQGKTVAFGEENDAWVYWIAEPLMCFYEPVQTWDSLGVQYLAPKSPDPACDLAERLAALP